jgi:microcin C transport system permease protein
MRRLGIFLFLVMVVAIAAHHAGLALPTLRWFHTLAPGADAEPTSMAEWQRWVVENWDIAPATVVGDAVCGLLALCGVLIATLGAHFRFSPLTLQKFKRFRSIGRGYASFRVLIILMVLAMCDQALVGKRALAVRYDGKWHFPAFEQNSYSEEFFGGKGKAEVDFRKLKERFAKAEDDKQTATGNRVIMPPVPWDPTFDSDDEQKRPIVERDGIFYASGKDEPYSGLGYLFHADDPGKRFRRLVFRRGKLSGRCETYLKNGEIAVVEEWKDGKMLSRKTAGNTGLSELEKVEATPLTQVLYPPVAPSFSRRHFLGTDSKGWDILAQLFGGLQIIFKASLIYLAVTYALGLSIGCMMGYFGGVFDITVQRFVEILSNVPFLYVVMIIAARIGRENITLINILLVMCLLRWIGISYYMRTATYREKERDYVAAARVLGAGPARVIFHHILPNALSTVVTLIPFSMSTITTALTALDFLGFGLPEKYPSWGRVLSDGVANMDSPWIVGSVFAMMVMVLLVVTFIGEAVREAYDPKKFTTYK